MATGNSNRRYLYVGKSRSHVRKVVSTLFASVSERKRSVFSGQNCFISKLGDQMVVTKSVVFTTMLRVDDMML